MKKNGITDAFNAPNGLDAVDEMEKR